MSDLPAEFPACHFRLPPTIVTPTQKLGSPSRPSLKVDRFPARVRLSALHNSIRVS